MGLETVPVITLEGLSEPQKKALRLADNKIALNAGWDTEILKLELAELSLPEIDIDLGLTGFSPGEIDVVLSEADDPDDEGSLQSRLILASNPATSGSLANTALPAVMGAMSNFSSAS